MLLAALLLGTSITPTARPPAFLEEWGEWGTGGGQFKHVIDVAIDSSANVYVADKMNHRIQVFDPEGSFLMMWGWGVDDGTPKLQVCTQACEAGISGSGDGQFDTPTGVAVDASGGVYVADGGNHRIQKFDSSGHLVAKWGTNGTGDVEFETLAGLAVSATGHVYVPDWRLSRVQKFNSSGALILMWGWGVEDGSDELQVCTGGCQAGIAGFGDGQFAGAYDIAVDTSGWVYVAETTAHRVQKFSSGGTFLRVWGWGVDDGSNEFQTCTSGCQIGLRGSGDGQFIAARGVAADSSGNVYVVDSENHRIQKFTGDGTFLTKWGSYGDGPGQFGYPESSALDPMNNVFVADTLGHRVQKFGPALSFFLGDLELPKGH
jgi:DNA-binding beta-propeller fold protein YncE